MFKRLFMGSTFLILLFGSTALAQSVCPLNGTGLW
jgi:hypothetical protein